MNISVLVDEFKCSNDENTTGNGTYINTNDYLTGQIENKTDGAEVLISTKRGVEKVEANNYNHDYAVIIDDWIQNRNIYQKDYQWYNNMKSTSGKCAGHFNEKVEHSNNIIDDTSESIKDFIASDFQDWPQDLLVKINLKKRQSAVDIHQDDFDFKTNGKIRTNMYLVAWKRRNDNTIQIHTYVTIFERTAGDGCKFIEDYWSGSRERIINAKKYYLLLKIEENPVYREFLLRHPQIE